MPQSAPLTWAQSAGQLTQGIDASALRVELFGTTTQACSGEVGQNPSVAAW